MTKNIFPQFGTYPLKNVPILKQTQKNHYSLRYIRVDRPAFFNASFRFVVHIIAEGLKLFGVAYKVHVAAYR